MDLISLVVVVVVRGYLSLAKLKIYFISSIASSRGIRTYLLRVILLVKV